MNIIVKIAAIFALIIIGLNVFAEPFMIGKPRKAVTASTYVIDLVIAAAIFILCGRVLGWY